MYQLGKQMNFIFENLKGNRKMRKQFIMAFVFALAVPLFFMANNCLAYGTYGTDVDSFCLDSNPISGNCLACHTSGNYSAAHAGKDAYNSGDYCYFCSDDSNCSASSSGGSSTVDADSDGYDATVDCNDGDASINPGATEICDDATDNDCNGQIDQQDSACASLTCTDNDGDGYSVEGGDCGAIDCNDTNADIHPGACDIKGDGIDQDCSGKDRLHGKSCPGTTGGIAGVCSSHGDRKSCKADGCSWSGKDGICR